MLLVVYEQLFLLKSMFHLRFGKSVVRISTSDKKHLSLEELLNRNSTDSALWCRIQGQYAQQGRNFGCKLDFSRCAILLNAQI